MKDDPCTLDPDYSVGAGAGWVSANGVYARGTPAKWHSRWSPENRGNHEGYTAGYFIESAINHYTLTGGQDRRLYDAAKRLADCWVANIGPGKKVWFDGHQEMEQALVRFGRFVNDMEGQRTWRCLYPAGEVPAG